MNKNNDLLKIGDDIYQFIKDIELERENIKDLVEYVHYKTLLDSFTFIIDKGKESGINLDFILEDYIQVISNLQSIFLKINEKYKTYEQS